MTETPRVPKAEVTGLFGAVVKAFSKKTFGMLPDSLGYMWHNQPVLRSSMSYGAKTRKWNACDESLKSYAHMATAAFIGCSFCLDFGYFMAQNDNLDLSKASEVPRWRSSDVFTPLERDVMEYAEAMSQTPTAVTDELSDRLLDALGPAALLELAAVIGYANSTARMNTALGIKSEGFSDACAVPLARAMSTS